MAAVTDEARRQYIADNVSKKPVFLWLISICDHATL